ncbi:MAG: aminopeptidase [Patescibacteria group bacterium]|nr:aminopeptidase [Patescibacteria group bacterium]
MAKKNYKKLEEQLTLKKKNIWEVWDDKTKKEAFSFAEGYKEFLNQAKTEREATRAGILIAKQNGFKNIAEVKNLKFGDKVYYAHRNRSLILATIGKEKISNGFRFIMSHIDSPHLDLKVTPLYEEENLAFFKTHYYGGIKKYQWPTIALALHGVVYLAGGKEMEINIGEDINDPVFMITDLLPHLDRPTGPGGEIRKREVQGEDLNLLIGSIPVNEKNVKEKVKLAVLEYLFNKYGIKEDDFASAELEAVPCEKARDLGFDRSLICAYGHDDSICSFAAIKALADSKNNEITKICVWIDREEIGSEGATGAQSIFIENFIANLLELSGEEGKIKNVYAAFSNAKAISADVCAGVDPDYKDVFDLRSAPRLGAGAVMEKYTGAGGKVHTSEASAKFVREIKDILNKNKNIIYQVSGNLGAKVDLGGGGTIAMFMANRDMDIVDMGVPLFNMHAPLEIASKADLYCAYLGYKAFFEN